MIDRFGRPRGASPLCGPCHPGPTVCVAPFRAIGSLLWCLFALLVCHVHATPPEHRIHRGRFCVNLVVHGQISARDAERFFVPRSRSWQVQLKRLVPEGTQVHQGDVVAVFDASALMQTVEDLKDRMLESENELASQTERRAIDLRRTELERFRAETAVNKARVDAGVPQGLLDTLTWMENQLQLKKAEAQLVRTQLDLENRRLLEESEARIADLERKHAEAELNEYQRLIDGHRLVAHSDGVAIHGGNSWEDRKIQVGDSLPRGAEVLHLPHMQSLEVTVWLGAAESKNVHPGQSVTMKLDAQPDTVFQGEVLGLSRRAQARRQWCDMPLFEARIAIHAPIPDMLRPGMSVQAEIKAQEREDALLVPLPCMKMDSGAWWVLLREGTRERVEPQAFNATHAALDPGEFEHLSGLTLREWDVSLDGEHSP